MKQTALEIMQVQAAAKQEFNAVGCYYDYAAALEKVDVHTRTPAQNIFLYNFEQFQSCVRSHVSEKILSEWKTDVHIAYTLARRDSAEKKKNELKK